MNNNGWIGVDFDGTLAEYHGWGNDTGKPVKPMVALVKKWLELGIEVRIVTARAYSDGTPESVKEKLYQVGLIKDWCKKHIGIALPVTCQKDYNMIQLWDDRAVGVEPNTGKRLGGYRGYDVGVDNDLLDVHN